MNGKIKKVPPHPMPKIQRFIDKFKPVFRSTATLHSAERYFTGLLSDIPYKNCGMMAEHVEGTDIQALQQFVSSASTWDFEKLNNQRVAHMLDNAKDEDGVLIFDDTGFLKKGTCSVGVSRQYSGTLGKIGNCQIAVSCQYADARYTWPVNTRLYLPENWTSDEKRLAYAKVPLDVVFKTKIQIALDLLDQANALGVKHEAIVADTFYGSDTSFLEGLESRGKAYAVAVRCDFTVRFEQDIKTFIPAEKPRGRGRPRIKPEPVQQPPQHRVDSLVNKIPESHWKVIAWRDGSKGLLKKQFAFLRVRWSTKAKTGSQGWLVFERPVAGDTGDTKYYFSNLPETAPEVKIVEYLHRRHLIERFYQDAKDELGLDQYEGRSWYGFHKHVGMVMLAYSWLVLQRKYQGSLYKQYEIVVDLPSTTTPSFTLRELFSP